MKELQFPTQEEFDKMNAFQKFTLRAKYTARLEWMFFKANVHIKLLDIQASIIGFYSNVIRFIKGE